MKCILCVILYCFQVLVLVLAEIKISYNTEDDYDSNDIGELKRYDTNQQIECDSNITVNENKKINFVFQSNEVFPDAWCFHENVFNEMNMLNSPDKKTKHATIKATVNTAGMWNCALLMNNNKDHKFPSYADHCVIHVIVNYIMDLRIINKRSKVTSFISKEISEHYYQENDDIEIFCMRPILTNPYDDSGSLHWKYCSDINGRPKCIETQELVTDILYGSRRLNKSNNGDSIECVYTSRRNKRKALKIKLILANNDFLYLICGLSVGGLIFVILTAVIWIHCKRNVNVRTSSGPKTLPSNIYEYNSEHFYYTIQ